MVAKMSDAVLQKKLNEMIDLGNALDAEAKRRYGIDGMLFHEADGSLCIMSGDCTAGGVERQKFVKFCAIGVRWGAGAW